MTTLPQLFDFVYTHLSSTVSCGLNLTSCTPLPSPPPPPPFVTMSLCMQQPSAVISAGPVGFGETITFPQVMMYEESFYWPHPVPPEPPIPGEGQYFSASIRQFAFEFGLKSHRLIRFYSATIDFPWGSVECELSEDSSGAVFGSDGTTMLTMAIGTPTI
jgi:hypothetical protein